MPESEIVSSSLPSSPAASSSPAAVKQQRQWYVAVVKNRSELKCQELLLRDMADVEDFDAFVATSQKEVKRADGSKKTVPSVVLPAKVFVRCTERERLDRVVRLPYILRFFMSTYRYSQGGMRMLAVIPDEQLQAFRRALEAADRVDFDEGVKIRKGISVQVKSGPLQGLTGVVISDLNRQRRLYIQLGNLGCASVEVDAANLKLL